ncbi:hypothetical protein [Marinoscillum furvescens]|uniref:Uncharacterized protein n=1 Tax=Marinoscillum furvescens DSM 4134 TaxID=1122208 RepID=A0A3D9LIN5_MARFU|nr:hypothetical protein [Marinoscillum furvescens]REE05683.1 hypothetical protein C7460_101200 [Marinoscillum furvescens DSM 4134]
MKLSIERNEEIIVVKSFIIQFVMFFILFLSIVSIHGIKSIEELFMLTNGVIVVFGGLILLAYLSQIVISVTFKELNFYHRALVSVVVNTVLMTLLIFSLDSNIETWLAILFATVYGCFFELPRLGIIAHYDHDKGDLKFVKWAIANYPKFLLAILVITLLLLLLNWPNISLGKVGIILMTNISIVTFFTVIAWRLKSNFHLRKIFTLWKIYGLTLGIVTLYAVANNLINRL